MGVLVNTDAFFSYRSSFERKKVLIDAGPRFDATLPSTFGFVKVKEVT
jgi:hypothetical protein